MDDQFLDLEAELKALRPRKPSPFLVEQIGRELRSAEPTGSPARSPYATATNLTSWKWFGWRTAAIAAAAAVLALIGIVGIFRPTPPSPASEPDRRMAVTNPENAAPRERYRPVAASNVLYDLKDEGLVGAEGAAPARRLRYRYLDTYTWKDPRTNASLKWSVPRDEIRVVPASMH